MRKLTYCEKSEILVTKQAWKHDEKSWEEMKKARGEKRIFVRATSLQQLERCAVESCNVNKILERY